MKIRSLGRTLIPYVYVSHEVPILELMVHGMEVVNDGPGPVEVASVDLVLEKGPGAVLTHHLSGGRLRRLVRAAAESLNRSFQTSYLFPVCFSRELGRRRPWSASTTLAAGEALAVVRQFLVARGATPTRLAVVARGSGEEVRRTFRLRPYVCRNRYVFPVPGLSRAYNGPATGVSHHRFTTSQEFAYDVIPCSARFRLGRGDGRSNRCFHGYRAPLVAPGPGRVVCALDGLPENGTIGECPPLTPERIERWGFLHAVAGNLVVLAHRHGEFSFLAHCAKGSVLVGEGDRVARGQRVALLGNTGNSTAPHLHYHLMDRPDFLGGRSLPVTFADVRDGFGDGEETEEIGWSPDPIVRAGAP